MLIYMEVWANQFCVLMEIINKKCHKFNEKYYFLFGIVESKYSFYQEFYLQAYKFRVKVYKMLF